jgi:hypothetical protein
MGQKPSSKSEQHEAQTKVIEARIVQQSLAALEKKLFAVQKTIIQELQELILGLRGKHFETQEEAITTITAIKRFVRASGQHLFHHGVPVTLQVTFPSRATKACSIEVRAFRKGKPLYLHTGPEFPRLSLRPRQ